MIRLGRRALGAAFVLPALGACGTRGQLYLPPPNQTSPTAGTPNVQAPALPANPNTTKDPD